MEIVKAYKFRVYPTKEQQELMNKTLGCCRFVYNFCRAYQKKEEDMWRLVSKMVQQGYFLENNYKSKFFNKNISITRKKAECHNSNLRKTLFSLILLNGIRQ